MDQPWQRNQANLASMGLTDTNSDPSTWPLHLDQVSDDTFEAPMHSKLGRRRGSLPDRKLVLSDDDNMIQ